MPFRIVTNIECAIASAGDADELSVVRIRAEVVESLVLNKDARCGDVEPGTKKLLEDTGGIQRRRRARS